MKVEERTLSMKAQWAKTAHTNIPVPPIPGYAYRNVALTAAEIESGQSYDKVFDSSRYNEMLHQVTGVIQAVERHGIAPYSRLTSYLEGALCLGPDGTIFQALKASGPGVSSGVKVTTDKIYWKDIAEDLRKALEEAQKTIKDNEKAISDLSSELKDTDKNVEQARKDAESAKQGAMPVAKGGAGVGQVIALYPNSTLPAGGAWLYYYWSITGWADCTGTSQVMSIAGGGTQVWNGGITGFAGWAWRIA